MGNYRVEVSASAEKTLFRLPKEVVAKIVVALQGLAVDPYPAGCRKLTGHKTTYRIRVGVYRIIYEVHHEFILVKVLKIGHRKDVYR